MLLFARHSKLGRGYDAARTYLHTNKPILNELLKNIRKALHDGGGVIGKAKSGGGESEEE
ncbi:hypothetical protein HZC00_02265 [Candidatus Kaiserbacteria bacterium]|nr:hypothetical protein [Candidatus Kaiserbacteria bacterium]